jgi:hypothetical protein
VNDSLLDLEDPIGIVIQSFGLQQYVKAGKILAVKKVDQLSVRGNTIRHLGETAENECG